MRSKFKWIFTLLLAFTMQFSFAQEKTVSGVVSDATGPLPGANVVVKGTTRSAQTDFDGKYSVKAKVGEVLLFSFTGYNDYSVVVGASNTYNAKLSEAKTMLSEVVVLGYDKKATKPKSVAAVTTVTAENFENRPNVTLLQSLQGSAPGLNVSTSSGSPGSAKIDLLIRGIGSLNSSTEPLYVIDGVATNSVVFRNINPEDIESASVLRDAIATSIYGNRGANGVIVITTKGGKYDSGLKFTYSSSTGYSELPSQHYNLADSQEVLTIERSSGNGIGNGDSTALISNTGAPLTDQEIKAFGNHNWMKDFFRTGVTQNHNLGMSVGGKNINNFSSLSYTHQDGIVPTTDFQRFTFRSNIDGKSNNEKFTYGTNFTVAYSKRNQLDQETSTTINNNSIQNPLLGSLTALPYLNPSMYPGTGQGLYDLIGTDFTYGNNTLVLYDILREGNLPNRIDDIKLIGNVNASYKLTKELTATTKLGVDYTNSERMFARAPWSYLAIAVRESNSVPYGGFERRSYDRDFGFNIVNSLKYSKSFGKHSLDIGLYMEYIKAHRNFSQLQQNGLDLKTYSFGAGTGWTNVGANYPTLRPTVSGFKADAGAFSYFGTAGYEYDDKYGVDLLVRRDASYRFVDDYTWGTFWSVGGRWNLNNENFLKDSKFNLLKLRASYGTQGNQNILSPAFGANPLYLGNDLVRDLVASGTGYGNTGSYDLSQLANTTLHWETQTMINFGLDFELWDSRFGGNIDVYRKRTSDLFNDINLSAVVGWGTSISGNQGGIDNQGIELALRYKLIKDLKGFKFNIFANASYNKNEITDLEKTIAGAYILEEGRKVYEYYYVPYLGVNPDNGNLLFLDKDGNITENPDDTDRRATGKSGTPDYVGSFGFNSEYKGFFLDAQFNFVANVWRQDTALFWLYNPSYVGDNNVSADLLNAWTPTNTITDIPSLTATNFTSGIGYSDMFLKDASYIRLKNVSFGYTFSKEMLRKSFMSSLKIYVQGENLHTWTKWKGFDPESAEASNLGRFPSPRVISFGLNVEF